MSEVIANHHIESIAEFRYNSTINDGGTIMPIIKSSAELRNNYNKVSKLCHEYNEPVFITKNGEGDLAVMSIELYEKITMKYELYREIQKGLDDVKAGRTIPFDDFIDDIKKV